MKKSVIFVFFLLQLLMLLSCERNDFLPIDPGSVNYSYAVQYIRADGGYEHDQDSVIHVVRSKKELDNYYDAMRDIYQLDYAENMSFVEACEKYDADYFKNQILLMVILEEPSGSNRHKVQKISESDGRTSIEIDRIIPECGDDDVASWHILIEPEAGFDAVEENITVVLDGKNISEKTVLAEYSEGYANISLKIPEGWEYEIDAQKEHGQQFSILFRPEGRSGSVKVCYMGSGFGVCGTGLSLEKINLGHYSATKGTYDNKKTWDYITIDDVPGQYVIFREGADSWWKEYSQKVMEILDTLRVAEGCLAEWRALPVAKKKCTIQYDNVYSEFNHINGDWRFTFSERSSGVKQIVIVHPDGKTDIKNAS